MDMSFREENFLQLAEKRLEQQHDTFTALDQKAWQNMSVSSIIIGLFSALNLKAIFDNPLTSVRDEALVSLGIVLIAYFLAFLLSLFSRRPMAFEYPMDMTWPIADKALNEHDDEGYYAFLLSSYVDAITGNNKRLNAKANRVIFSTAMLGIAITFLVIAAIAQAG